MNQILAVQAEALRQALDSPNKADSPVLNVPDQDVQITSLHSEASKLCALRS